MRDNLSTIDKQDRFMTQQKTCKKEPVSRQNIKKEVFGLGIGSR